jgi:hypothetical protein
MEWEVQVAAPGGAWCVLLYFFVEKNGCPTGSDRENRFRIALLRKFLRNSSLKFVQEEA